MMKLQKYLLLSFLTAVLHLSSKAQQIYFPPLGSDEWATISPDSFSWCPEKIDSLYHFLELENTKAFMLLKDGKIVLEKYFNDHNQNKAWYWASAGKTITSFLTGKAREVGLLEISDPSSQYLGTSWTNCPESEELKITVRHQLTMTTGLDDHVDDPFCTLDTCLNCLASPGTRWSYHNAPYTLLDGVIETATGKTLNAYASQILLIPTGMTGLFLKMGYNNVFYSTARSMARFGILMLNQGKWADKTILSDTTYFREMTSTSQSINQSYGYLWWLNGKESFMIPQSQIVFNGSLFPNAPADMISALGANGQFLNISPSTGWIMLRMGESPDSSPVPFLMNDDIWRLINQLPCEITSTERTGIHENCQFFPNPASSELFFNTKIPIKTMEILNVEGKPIISYQPGNLTGRLRLPGLPNGVYLVRTIFANGNSEIQKLQVIN